MGDHYRTGIYVLGGVLLGVVGSVLIGQQKGRLRPAAATILSKGLDVKEQATTAFEIAKEQTEDLFAEAEELRRQRRTAEGTGSGTAGDEAGAS